MEGIIPFKYTGPLDPEHDSLVSITRHEELKEVVKGVSNQTYYAIVGPRQIGKTTFLFQLLREISENLHGFQGIYLTLEDLVQVKHQDFYKNFARKIISSLSSRYRDSASIAQGKIQNGNHESGSQGFPPGISQGQTAVP